MSFPQNPGVKTLQHQKAIGNARAQVRGFMFPVFVDIADAPVETEYGIERGGPTDPAAPITLDEGNLEGLIAYGRMERIPAESMLDDVRIRGKEAYRLYWLPSAYENTAGDYRDNPLGLDVNLSGWSLLRKLEPGMTVWIAAEAVAGVPRAWSAASLDGAELTAFEVVDAPININGEVVEYEAMIAKDEAAPRRRLALI